MNHDKDPVLYTMLTSFPKHYIASPNFNIVISSNLIYEVDYLTDLWYSTF